MCDIPLEIANAENIVRAIFSNHVDGKSLRRGAFFEPKDDLSVMRHTYMESDNCKKQALMIRPANPNIKYKGLAIIRAVAIRGAGSDVFDSRDGNFCGHAHVKHGLTLPPAEDPLYAEQKIQLDDRLRDLKKAAKYYPDPDPTGQTWTGGEVKPLEDVDVR